MPKDWLRNMWTTPNCQGHFKKFECFSTLVLWTKLVYKMYTRYLCSCTHGLALVYKIPYRRVRAWPSGCRVRARATVSCIQASRMQRDGILYTRYLIVAFRNRACLITLHSNFEIFQKGHPAVEFIIDRRIFERWFRITPHDVVIGKKTSHRQKNCIGHVTSRGMAI